MLSSKGWIKTKLCYVPSIIQYQCGCIVREVKARGMKREVTLKMSGEDQEWEVSQLLFIDDTDLVDILSEKLTSLVREFGRVC